MCVDHAAREGGNGQTIWMIAGCFCGCLDYVRDVKRLCGSPSGPPPVHWCPPRCRGCLCMEKSSQGGEPEATHRHKHKHHRMPDTTQRGFMTPPPPLSNVCITRGGSSMPSAGHHALLRDVPCISSHCARRTSVAMPLHADSMPRSTGSSTAVSGCFQLST